MEMIIVTRKRFDELFEICLDKIHLAAQDDTIRDLPRAVQYNIVTLKNKLEKE